MEKTEIQDEISLKLTLYSIQYKCLLFVHSQATQLPATHTQLKIKLTNMRNLTGNKWARNVSSTGTTGTCG